MLHGAVVIGAGATVGHLCIVHSAEVGEEALIGNGAIVLDSARIGARALVAAGSTVTPGTEIPDETVAAGTPARIRGPLTERTRHWVETNPGAYRDIARRHAASSRPVD